MKEKIRGRRLLLSVNLAALAVLILCCVLFSVNTKAAATASGTSGGITWTLSSAGTLTLKPTSGSSGRLASMSDSDQEAPWYDYHDEIIKVSVSSSYTIKLASDGECRGLLNACHYLTNIDGLQYFDVSNATDLRSFFGRCYLLEDLDAVSDWTFSSSKTVKASYLCISCTSLEDASGISGWNIQAEHLYMAFYGCSALTSLDLSGWDTSACTNFNYLFSGCSALETLDLSSFDTSGDTNDYKSRLFYNCSALSSVKLGSAWTWNDSETTETYGSLPTPPTSSGYNGKWVRSDDSGAAYGKLSAANLAKNWTSSYAGTWVWAYADYTVSFSANASDASGSTASQSMEYGTTYTLNANGYTRSGYTFSGWAKTSSGSVAYADGASVKNLTATDGATVTLYAVWEEIPPITYSVSYDANGGSGSMDGIDEVESDEWITLSENGFAAPSIMYVFTGWNTAADGSGYDYDTGESVQNLTQTDGDTVVLYAQWGEKSWQYEYISTDNVYDPDEDYYDDDGNVLEITSGEDLYPASEGYTGYWTKLSDDTWMYTFYVQDDSLTYYTYEEDLTSELADTFTGDYTILNPYTIEDGSDTSTIAVISNSDGTSETGNLSVTKRVISADGTDYESTKLFTVRISLDAADSGADLSGTQVFGSYIFTDGVLELKMGDDETVSVTDIPAGVTYTVTEILSEEQEAYYEVTTEGSLTGTIIKDETASVTITNSGEEESFGSLCITKQVLYEDGSDYEDESAFPVTVVLTDENGENLSGTLACGSYVFTDGVLGLLISDNQEITISGIPEGYHYTVTEEVPDGYTVTYEGQTGQIAADEVVYASLTNTTDTPGYGSLRIFKQVQYEDGSEFTSSETFRVTLTLTDRDGNALSGTQRIGNRVYTDGSITVSISDDDDAGETCAEFTEIPAGYHYSVTEELSDDQSQTYTVSYSGETGTIGTDTVSVVTITNRTGETPLSGPLTIEKKTDGYYETDDAVYVFHVSFQNLTPGASYEMTFTDEDGEEISPDERNAASVTAASDGTADETIYLSGDQKVRIDDLPVGTVYQVTEEGGDYTASYILTDENELGSIASSSGASSESGIQLQTACETLDASSDETQIEDVTVTFTNTLIRTQDIRLTKISLDQYGNEDADDETAYQITAVFAGLVPESDYLYSDGGSTAYFSSDSDGGALVVLYLANGDTCTFTGIPVGAQYWFAESADRAKTASYTVTDANETGQITLAADENEESNTSLTTEAEVVNEGEEITVAFTNTSSTASVKIRKLSDDGTALGGAVFDLYRAADNEDEEDELVEEDIVTSSEEADEGWSDVIEGLCTGSYYFVETQAPDGYYVSENTYDFTVSEAEIDTTISVTAKDTGMQILASTGGIGLTVIILISLLLACLGILTAFVKKKRRDIR